MAVLAVVLFHASVPGLSGGFVGVDVFFVLSGYLITGLLLAEHERTGRISFARFYARRVRRLLPAAMLVVLTTCVAGAVLYSPLEQLRYASAAAATSGYGSNVWFLLKSADYFSPNVATNPFLHMWSLAVEEQFYLVWPLLIILGCWRGAARRRLIALLVAVTVVSFGLCVWLTGYRSTWAFFLTPVRAWEFGVGGLLALVPAAALGEHHGAVRATGWLGAGALLATFSLFSSATRFPGVAALIPTLATVALLLPGHAKQGTGAPRLLESEPWQTFGRLSYSWYLWHWPVVLMALVLWPRMPVAGRLWAAVIALALAAATYRLLERPVRDSARLAALPQRALALGAGLTLGGVTAGLLWGRIAQQETMSPNQRAYLAAAASSSILDSRKCVPGATDSSLHQCVIGEANASTTVVAIGDSHLGHWYAALDALGKAKGWRILTLIKAGCPTATIPVYNEGLGREYRECAVWRAQAIRRVAEIRPAGIFLANAHGYRTGATTRATVSDWHAGFRRTIAAWDSLGVRTVVLRDTPTLSSSTPECLSGATSRPWYSLAACSTPRAKAIDTVQLTGAMRATRELRHATVVDFADVICPGAVCAPTLGDIVIYKDGNHLTTAFVRWFAPTFIARIAPLLEHGRP